jgi:glycosyltransferase involved in cell wall biosynthesis
MKYSAIVPTMLKSPRFFKLVDDLIKSEYVDEVIVIDNSGKTEPSIESHPKLNYVCEGRNTGCNPAWNKGVELSKNDLLVIVNDDVNFDPIILSVLTDEMIEQHGIVGMGVGNWDGYNGVPFTYEGNPYLEEWRPGVNDAGWASLFMLKKSQWIPIPEDIIVWYGDNFIKDVNPVKKSILRGFRCETDMSTTTDLPELDEIKKQDLKNWLIHFNNRDKWRQ